MELPPSRALISELMIYAYSSEKYINLLKSTEIPVILTSLYKFDRLLSITKRQARRVSIYLYTDREEILSRSAISSTV